MKKLNQYELVEKHLLNKGSITSWKAFKKYGITRLSHYIYLMRKNGYKIENNNETKKNRYGYYVTFSNYTLVPNNQEEK